MPANSNAKASLIRKFIKNKKIINYNIDPIYSYQVDEPHHLKIIELLIKNINH